MSTSRDGSRVVYTSNYDLPLILGYAAQYGDTYLILVGNLSRNKPATQSSTFAAPWAAGKAVDGTTDGVFNNAASSSTNFDANAWWQVDLGSSATVSSVVVWNRTDCCQDRLGDYWIFISDTPFTPSDTPATLQNRTGTWSNHQTVAPNPNTAIPVPSAIGRYLRVQLSGTGYLTLAEVQVIGVIGGGSGGPDLIIVKTHTGNFVQGQKGATYNITVSNIGTASTSGSTVTVTETLPPSGLTPVSMLGNNWNCTQPAGPCTRSSVVAASGSYETIVMTVNVTPTALSSLTNSAAVAGGGQTSTANDQASDQTTVVPLVSGSTSSIWSPAAGPGIPWRSDGAVTLGVKFRSDVSGTVSGVRFYKGGGEQRNPHRAALQRGRQVAGPGSIHGRDHVGMAAGKLLVAGRDLRQLHLRCCVPQHYRLRL
jgi:uncharacterized repeat protein (TIGR01451 family)